MARAKGCAVVLILVLLHANASVPEDWTGRQASGIVEDFYLQALSTLTGLEEFSGLSASDLKWLFNKISDYTPNAIDESKSVFSRELVKDFLCSRRGVCETRRSRFPLYPVIRQGEEEATPSPTPSLADREDDFIIGTKPCEPFVFCRPDKDRFYGSREAGRPRGYSIDLIEEIMDRLGLRDKYKMVCIAETPALVDKVAGGEFLMGTACISVTSERMPIVDFSRVYYYSGLEVMILRPTSTSKDPLSMLDPFTWDVWVSVFATIILVGIAIWVFERNRNAHMKTDAKHGLPLGQWHSWTTFLQNPFINYRSWPARLTVLAFMMVSLVIVATYTANLAAFLTKQSLQVPIRGRNDLAGKRVGTSSESTSGYKWLRAQDQSLPAVFEDNDERFKALEDGAVDAIVWDSPPLRYRAFQECDKVVVGDVFQLEDYAIAVHPNRHSLRLAIDEELVTLREEGYNDDLYAEWFQGVGTCDPMLSQDVEGSETDAVSLETTWVLFAFQLIVLGIAIVIHLFPIVVNFFRRRRQDKEVEVSEDSLPSVSFADASLFKSNAELLGQVPLE
eukprot:CAMPEP_0113963010 /NCGR_PEP_ID=MMETSP0011_2-20120614/6260_1 /TAXON_ID=101924 /ORGANISM="Rhodosorus marinus" /LENGTH=561 /DNA_ID=CAMNT_0000974981 /DNA_START=304 /DNA_END=1989 /DNA_ORIENTATION=+ /assembly_acc=CAM_ASM_000156